MFSIVNVILDFRRKMRGKVDIINFIVVYCRYSYEYFCVLKFIKNKIVFVKFFFKYCLNVEFGFMILVLNLNFFFI